jgi:putative intracellular protease/amidase
LSRVLIPLPDTDFDVTAMAVPWKLLTRAGHAVTFATERGGQAPAADPLLLTGVLFGQLGAGPSRSAATRSSPARRSSRHPSRGAASTSRSSTRSSSPAAMRPGCVNTWAARSCSLGRPWGAICHGVLVAARAGVLKGRRTTCLPFYMERTAYFLTAWKLGTYYRTYLAYVEEEVRAALAAPGDFVRGPTHLMRRGTDADDGPAFVVEDGHYGSARWPGDAYKFARALSSRLPAPG